MSTVSQERVLSVHHWNDSLFSFKTTRNGGLRFRNGHFVMIGLRGRRSPAAARLQLRERQLRRSPRVLQHQGAGRPAHLAPAAHSPRRSDPRRQQADRDADPRPPAARQAAVPAGQRNGPRAVHEPGPRSGGVRALRDGGPRPRRPARQRSRLPRLHRGRAARSTSSSAKRSSRSSATTRPSRARRFEIRAASPTSSTAASCRPTSACRRSTPPTIA